MNRFLLLVLTAGLLSPIASQAETYWLLLKGTNAGGSFSWEVPIGSKSDCELELDRSMSKSNWEKGPNLLGGICVKGKQK
tara:strand:- start:71 stop:310 length:240 start_codon:yes stop_codon:yes gene_type:complete